MTTLDAALDGSESGSIKTSNGLNLIASQQNDAGKLNLLVRTFEVAKVLGRLKQKGVDILQMLREYVDSHIEKTIETAPQKPECAKGCSHCCYQVVSVSDAEALRLMPFVKDEMLPALKDQQKDIAQGGTPDQFPFRLGKEKSRCIFLKDGVCSVYEERPLTCRLVLSLKAEACNMFMNGKKEPIPKISINAPEVAVSAYMQVEQMRPLQTILWEKLC